ncbi:MAG: class I SAM-dependent methyltransferase [Chloroflexota bacterium]
MTTIERDKRLAHYYDLEYRDYTEDIDFYVQLADALDPDRRLPVLELGCGTGRIAVALAEAGFRVTCVDMSEGMLEHCRHAAAAKGVEALVTPVQADMRDLADVPEGPYNLAFCALNTFAYLDGTAAQTSMLAAVHPLLVQHGILVLDLTPPWPHLLPPSDGELIQQGTYPDSDGSLVRKLVTGTSDLSTQTYNVTLLYDAESTTGALTRISQDLTLHATGRYEMELLLKLARFDLEDLYGSYGLDDFNDSSERMIFIART